MSTQAADLVLSERSRFVLKRIFELNGISVGEAVERASTANDLRAALNGAQRQLTLIQAVESGHIAPTDAENLRPYIKEWREQVHGAIGQEWADHRKFVAGNGDDCGFVGCTRAESIEHHETQINSYLDEVLSCEAFLEETGAVAGRDH